MPGLAEFFEAAYGNAKGYMCVASRRTTGKFTEKFFKYPDQLKEAISFSRLKAQIENVYFCPQLLTEARRNKSNVDTVSCVWADLDACSPELLQVKPTLALETSPGRYQAIWTLKYLVPGEDAEAASRRIAYGHAQEGSDRSGWDLTQLLRVPGTYNYKYENVEPYQVKIIDWNDNSYELNAFDMYPQVEGYEYLDIPFPDLIPEKGSEILERNRFRVSGAAFTLFHRAPEADRSAALFRLEMYCFEGNLSLADTFQVCRDALCNKFADDDVRLWKDICRAKSRFNENRRIQTLPPGDELSLLTAEETARVGNSSQSFVDRYVAWAKTVGDAPEQYHVATAFTCLSALLSGSVKLPTSYGTIRPNLWFMILAETTLTRKSTAMELGMDIVTEIDDNTLMATDGSIEGLMTALQARKGVPSVFLRDEFTGLIQQMSKKDYLAGMPEFFTKLYDGRDQKRLLRKEETIIRNPLFILFTGGIKSKMTRLLTYEHVDSGFLPRFIIVTAEADPTKVKPLGPPVEKNTKGRDRIKTELREISSIFDSNVPIVINGKVAGVQKVVHEARMTPDAWGRYNELEQTLTGIGSRSGELSETLVPMNVRLAVSILKCALLLAVAESPAPPVEITELHILRAASYGDSWRRFAQDVTSQLNRGEIEHKIQLYLNAVTKSGSMPRTRLMQMYHLTAREMDDIYRTLNMRGLATVGGEGRMTTYNILGGE